MGNSYVYPAEDLEAFLQSHCGGLTERQRDIFRLRCGLLDNRPCSLEEVGLILDISRERVRQLESMTVRYLRRRGLRPPVRKED